MSISSFHYSYIKNYPRWTLCTDVLEGEDVIKSKGSTYLPLPLSMTPAEYASYKQRAAFVNYTGRARDAMVGLVGRKKPTFNVPEKIKEYAKDITTTGMGLETFALATLKDLLRTGRGGILVEYPSLPEGELSIQDVEDLGLRPYFVYFRAEDILDWRTGIVKGKKVLTYIKLREFYEDSDPKDPYSVVAMQRVRILRLNEEGKCIFELFDAKSSLTPNFADMDLAPITGTEDPVLYSQGEPLDYIPFVPLGPWELSIDVQRPPLLDMAWVNIHHYCASADRNHAIHWADVPTPVIIGSLGLDKDGNPITSIKLGPTSAINIQDSSGDAKFLEITGNGINPTKELMEEYEKQMSVLGNKILATDTRSSEAAETAAIHRAGEQAVLATMANVLSEGITIALTMLADRAGEDGYIYYHLSTDYIPNSMDSQTLIALIKAVIAGKISDKEFFDAIVAGELVRSDKTYEEHQKELAEAPKNALGPDETKEGQEKKELTSVGISTSDLDVSATA